MRGPRADLLSQRYELKSAACFNRSDQRLDIHRQRITQTLLRRVQDIDSRLHIHRRLRPGGQGRIRRPQPHRFHTERGALLHRQIKPQRIEHIMIDHHVQHAPAKATGGGHRSQVFGKDARMPQPRLMSRGDQRAGGVERGRFHQPSAAPGPPARHDPPQAQARVARFPKVDRSTCASLL